MTSTPNTSVLLIGASRGLGLAMATEYLALGANVVDTEAFLTIEMKRFARPDVRRRRQPNAPEPL